jgi:type IV pilus assembly protein PilF
MKRRPLQVLAVALLLGAAQAGHAQENQTDREKAAAVNAELAITYMKQDNLRAAREKADKALAQNPRSVEAQMAAGFVYDRLGEDRKAGGHFEQAVKLAGKDNPDTLNNAAVFQCRKGDKKRGVELFLQAAASPLYRTPEVAYANAGYCARAAGLPKDAERYFREALARRPNMPDPLLQLADLAHEAGNDLQARAFVQRYHEATAASAQSLWLGYRIEQAQGDRAAAAEYARRLRMEFPTSAETGQLFDEERKAQ